MAKNFAVLKLLLNGPKEAVTMITIVDVVEAVEVEEEREEEAPTKTINVSFAKSEDIGQEIVLIEEAVVEEVDQEVEVDVAEQEVDPDLAQETEREIEEAEVEAEAEAVLETEIQRKQEEVEARAQRRKEVAAGKQNHHHVPLASIFAPPFWQYSVVTSCPAYHIELHPLFL